MWVFLAKQVIQDLKERRSAHCYETAEAEVVFSDHDIICCRFCCCDGGGGGGGRGMLDHKVCLARRDPGEPLEKMVKEARWERKAMLD